MFNLMIKDVVVQRKTILFGFVYILIMMVAFSNGGPAMFTAGAFAVTFMMIQTPCAHDDKSRADAMLNSLPIKRNAIVNARYLSILLYIAIALIEYVAVYTVIRLSGLPLRTEPVTVENFVGLLAAVGIFISVYYPILFRFGYMKTRYVTIFLFTGLFSAGSALVLMFAGKHEGQAETGLVQIISSQPDWLVGSGILGILLGFVLVSYLLSVRFYSRREF